MTVAVQGYAGHNAKGEIAYTVRPESGIGGSTIGQPRLWTVYHHRGRNAADLSEPIAKGATLDEAEKHLSKHFAITYGGQPVSLPGNSATTPKAKNSAVRKTCLALTTAGLLAAAVAIGGVGSYYLLGTPQDNNAAVQTDDATTLLDYAREQATRREHEACGDNAAAAASALSQRAPGRENKEQEAAAHAQAAQCYALAGIHAEDDGRLGQKRDYHILQFGAIVDAHVEILESENYRRNIHYKVTVAEDLARAAGDASKTPAAP